MTICENGDSVTSPFGKRKDPITGQEGKMHNGLDSSRGPGTQQRGCLNNANVEYVSYGYNYGRGTNVILRQDTPKGVVRIRHQHAAKILVSKGQRVSAFDFVATEGSSGSSTGSHDHIEVTIGGSLDSDGEVRNGAKVVDPTPWLHYSNTIGFKPRNDDIYDYATGTYNTQKEDGEMGILRVFGAAKGINVQAFNTTNTNMVALDGLQDGDYIVKANAGTAEGYTWYAVFIGSKEYYMPTGGAVQDRCQYLEPAAFASSVGSPIPYDKGGVSQEEYDAMKAKSDAATADAETQKQRADKLQAVFDSAKTVKVLEV